MNRELRRVSIVVLLMFLALFTSTTIIQAIEADSLARDDRNVRTLYASYSAERGPILVDGQPVAESVPVDDEYQYLRTYPHAELYSAVTGYFTLNQGNSGVEGAMNDVLSGTSDEQFFDRITAIFTGENPTGAAVELTIDPAVQQAAWDALGEQAGAVVALDPATGEVLAMVSKPGYDPNVMASHDTQQVIDDYNALLDDAAQPLINRTIAGGLYHPGSTFKVLMAAAAIDSGRFTPESEFDNPAELQLPNSSAIVRNAGGGTCGPGETVTLADALRLSCNIPFAELGAELGEDVVREYAEAFGFGTSLEIPMTTTASVYPEVADDAQLMLSSFGQFDVRATPLQIAMWTAAVANGGALMQPELVESVLAPDLTVLDQFEPAELGRPISRETADTVRQMMVDNVSRGVATNARMEGVDVGGKTGTAENGEDEPYTLLFTGFAPAEDPQAVVAVVVENGGGRGQSSSGNEIAAPIGRQVLEAVLNR